MRHCICIVLLFAAVNAARSFAEVLANTSTSKSSQLNKLNFRISVDSQEEFWAQTKKPQGHSILSTLDKLQAQTQLNFVQGIYKLEIVAKKGQVISGSDTIDALGWGPSINDAGQVAFTAAISDGRHAIFVADGSFLEERSLLSNSFYYSEGSQVNNLNIHYLFGNVVQINNDGQVVWMAKPRDGLIWFILRQGSIQEDFKLVAKSHYPLYDSYSPFEADLLKDPLKPWVTITNKIGNISRVVFTAVPKTNHSHTIFATPVDTETGGHSDESDYYLSAAMLNEPDIYPMISDNIVTVFRLGKEVTDDLVVFLDETMTSPYKVAGSPDYLAVGEKPGIADDAHMITFMGHHQTLGVGIFGKPGPSSLVKIAGISGDGILDPGESWDDIDGDGIVDPGEDFGPFETDGIQAPFSPTPRVGVNLMNTRTENNYLVAYLANGKMSSPGQMGPMGLYVSRVDRTDPWDANVYDPVRILQVGDEIDGLSGAINQIALYDPVNNEGQIVFWVKTTTGAQAIIRATAEPEFINVVQIDPLNDIDYNDSGILVNETVWQKEYNSSGDLVDVVPEVNYPIVDNMEADGKDDDSSFLLKIKLSAYPSKPSWIPTVKYTYCVVRDDWLSYSVPCHPNTFEGWEGEIKIKTPQSIGKYKLDLDFEILKDGESISWQRIPLTLYTLFKKPKGSVSVPNIEWIEKATQWAKGANNPKSILLKLMSGIYEGAKESDCNWVYIPSEKNWKSLKGLGGSETTGNCVTMSKLWDGLAKVFGINNTSIDWTSRHKNYCRPFLTTTPAIAFDGKSGNAHPPGTGCDSSDRWWFTMHCVGKASYYILISKYYDPTINATYKSFDDFIECKMTGLPEIYGSFREMECEDFSLLCTNKDCYGWGEHVYFNSSPASEIAFTYEQFISELSFGSTGFTGAYFIATIDDDSDGRFNQLSVTAEVNVVDANGLYMQGYIAADGNYITERAHMYSVIGSSTEIQGQGLIDAELLFSGYDIGLSDTNGPYTVNLWLIDSNGIVINEIDINTPPYFASQFGETAAEIVAANDVAVDNDSNSIYDALKVSVDVNVFQAGDYYIDATLITSDGNGIVSAEANDILSAGLHTIDVNLDGRQINKVADVNSYTISLVLRDANGTQQDSFEFVTNVYNPIDFERKDVIITGPYGDFGVDTTGNGLFNSLRFEAQLDVNVAGDYNITTWLQDSNGYDITYAETDVNLPLGTQTVLFDFDGYRIRAHQTDGPYSVIYLLIENEEGVVDSSRTVHTTSNYNFDDFDLCVPGDFTGDCKVRFDDLASLGDFWLINDRFHDVAPPPEGDSTIDILELAVLAENWLAGIE